MANGMWTAVSGANAKSQAIETLSNNLANVETPGFKEEQVTFKEYLSTEERDHDRSQMKPTPPTDQDLNPLNGKDTAHVVLDGTHTRFAEGGFQITRSPLDFAISGEGFFEVSTPRGNRYTRAGSFQIVDGKLTTAQGDPVLAEQKSGVVAPPAAGEVISGSPKDPAVAGRFIEVPDLANLSVTDDGQLYSGESPIGKLSIVNFEQKRFLQKDRGQLFANTQPDSNAAKNANGFKVSSGILERSNVNPIEQMTRLIQAHRGFEQDLKAIRTYGEMLGKESDIGKF